MKDLYNIQNLNDLNLLVLKNIKDYKFISKFYSHLKENFNTISKINIDICLLKIIHNFYNFILKNKYNKDMLHYLPTIL